MPAARLVRLKQVNRVRHELLAGLPRPHPPVPLYMSYCRALTSACTDMERARILDDRFPEWWDLQGWFAVWPQNMIRRPGAPREEPVPEGPMPEEGPVPEGPPREGPVPVEGPPREGSQPPPQEGPPREGAAPSGVAAAAPGRGAP